MKNIFQLFDVIMLFFIVLIFNGCAYNLQEIRSVANTKDTSCANVCHNQFNNDYAKYRNSKLSFFSGPMPMMITYRNCIDNCDEIKNNTLQIKELKGTGYF